MNINDIHDNDGQLDQLFQSARNEAPKYKFTEARTVFTSALAIGVATAAHAKVITSALFKSKIFIMSISTITAITSAVLIYSSATTPNSVPVISAEERPSTKKELAYVEPQEKPQEALFVDDSLKREKISKDSVKVITIDINDNIIKTRVLLNDERIKELSFHLDELETLDIDLEELEDELEFNLSELEGLTIDLEDLEENMEELTLMAEMEMEELEDLLENEVEIIYSDDESDLETVTHFITNRTTLQELEDIKKAATAAGIKFNYTAKVKRNIIKKLNLNMTLVDDNGRTKRECVNMTISGDEMFSHTLQWKVNAEGKAVSFGRAECRVKKGGKTSTQTRIIIANPPNPVNPANPANPANPENPENPANPEAPVEEEGSSNN